MIFVTVGTERFPFDRLLRAVDKLARQGLLKDVYCQTGASVYKPVYCSYKVFLPFEELVYCIQKSDLVIAHGGAGIVALCLKFGKIPILVPRQKRFGEHVDDHQVEFARHMEHLQRAVAVLDLERFDEALAKQHQLQACWESGQLTPSPSPLSPLPPEGEGSQRGEGAVKNSLLGKHLRELLARWEQTLYPNTSK